jgi:hypothetical protein
MSTLQRILGGGIQGYHPTVARAVGSVAAAIFAEHVSFWQEKSNEGWAWRTQEQIEEATCLSRKVQERARRDLMDAGVLEQRLRGVPARLHYKIDYEALERVILDCPNGTSQYAPKGQTGVPQRDKLASTNGTNYIEEKERERVSNTLVREAEASDPPPPEPEKPTNRKPQQVMFEKLYLGLEERYGFKLREREYKNICIKQFGILVEDGMSEEVEDRVINHMINRDAQKRLTPLQAYEDVCRGRDDGSAWAGPAPWEKAKEEKEDQEVRKGRERAENELAATQRYTREQEQRYREIQTQKERERNMTDEERQERFARTKAKIAELEAKFSKEVADG